MHEDFDRCYRAVQARDERFDGWFITAVLSTGIYCRPSCPARPLARNVRFYPTTAAAQHAGFRACKRCRPDASPGSPDHNAGRDVVARAMRLIADGVVDRDGVGGLAGRLGYSTRQIERHLRAGVGAGPLALARAQRAQTARLLIDTTDLPFTEVAFAAGFSSIRQFNDTVRTVFDVAPSGLRDRRSAGPPAVAGVPGALDLRLVFRRPLAVDSLFGHLGATAVAGVEEIRDGGYRRTLRLPNGPGTVSLTPRPDYIACRLRLTDLRDVPTAIVRCRRLLDLDADPEAVGRGLGADPLLATAVAAAPGRRVPRTVDEAELAVRVVLGQQVSTAAARTLTGRLVEAFGEPVADPDGGLTHLFPGVEALTTSGLADLAVPRARARCLAGLVAALADGVVELGPGVDPERTRSQLARLAGVGPWTVEMVVLRGLGDPDAFPATDLGVRRGARALGLDDHPTALARRSGRWRPWRAYAVQYLWAATDHRINRWPVEHGPVDHPPIHPETT